MAVKVTDGLFWGDYLSSQDVDFIMFNKVTHIINCAGYDLPNQFQSEGVK